MNTICGCHDMTCPTVYRGRQNGRPIVRNAILALSDKWLSLDTRPMDEQIIIAQMSFINLGQVHIWFRTSADAMILVSASQISRQPLVYDWIILKGCHSGYSNLKIYSLVKFCCGHTCQSYRKKNWQVSLAMWATRFSDPIAQRKFSYHWLSGYCYSRTLVRRG